MSAHRASNGISGVASARRRAAARRARLPAERPTPPATNRNEHGGLTFRLLAAAYFLEGFGYIVSGTFAVTAVQHTPGLERWAPWVWVAAGVADAPSALLWNRMADRFGAPRALVAVGWFEKEIRWEGTQVERLGFSALWAVTSVVSLIAGSRFGQRILRSYGLGFLIIEGGRRSPRSALRGRAR